MACTRAPRWSRCSPPVLTSHLLSGLRNQSIIILGVAAIAIATATVIIIVVDAGPASSSTSVVNASQAALRIQSRHPVRLCRQLPVSQGWKDLEEAEKRAAKHFLRNTKRLALGSAVGKVKGKLYILYMLYILFTVLRHSCSVGFPTKPPETKPGRAGTQNLFY